MSLLLRRLLLWCNILWLLNDMGLVLQDNGVGVGVGVGLHVVVALSSSATTPKTVLSSDHPKPEPKPKPKPKPNLSIVHRQQQLLATNWFSIATHLQNPTLYSAEWANACEYNVTSQTLVTSKPVQRGDIISLVPIHAIGLQGGGSISSTRSSSSSSTTTTTTTTSKSDSSSSSDWMVFDADQDQDYFQPKTKTKTKQQRQPKKKKKKKNVAFGGRTPKKSSSSSSPPQQSPFRYGIPQLDLIPHSQQQQHQQQKNYDDDDDDDDKNNNNNNEMVVPKEMQRALFCDVNPTRPPRTGWMGHLTKTRFSISPSSLSPLSLSSDTPLQQQQQQQQQQAPNCIVAPIAMPLCALVAIRDLPKGTALVEQAPQTTTVDFKDAEQHVLEKHKQDILELQEYMNMAYPKPEPEPEPLASNNKQLNHPFYDMPRDHPNLQVLRSDPDVLAVHNFLSDAECDRLIHKAQPHLVPCVTKNPRTGAVEQDISRTSRNANIPQIEVPSIVEKLTQLTNCTKEQLEILQVLHYAPGQYFEAHTDGFTGPVSACGFETSARLVTIFCYLNHVEQGGATRFGSLDLDVVPRKGTAVIHFPTTLGFEEDARTQHEGMLAIDEKWLLVTWVWMHPRDQNSIYAETRLDPLCDERI